MPRAREKKYDDPQFAADWNSRKPLREIASEMEVSINSIYIAAMRRGFEPRLIIRARMAEES